MSKSNSAGTLFVLSAPSGTGKTTVATMLLPMVENLHRTISHTTRKMRAGETNGVDYHFVTEERFQEMITAGEFVEWAQIFGNHYGTSTREIESSLAAGQDLLLVIDVQGAASVKRMPSLHSVSIFLLPPSIEELERRLVGRGLDSREAIQVRLDAAKGELKHKDEFDHQVMNDNLTQAVEAVREIVLAHRARRPGPTAQ
ncbi:MAG: guanylate kinase [Nitrospinota bacterium]|nr:guanylate kinase [Nitrospinota bacterium]